MKDLYGKIAFVLSLAIAVFLLVDKLQLTGNSDKVGVVQMEKLVYDYQGMKDATEEYTAKMNAWQGQSDSLESMLQRIYTEMKMDSIEGDLQKLRKDQERFVLIQQQYYQYQENVQKKAKEEDEQMTSGIINQLNECIKKYAKQNGYSMIIANTQMENVSYVEDAQDLTDEILDFANSQYNGE